jgi:hypothetical protein
MIVLDAEIKKGILARNEVPRPGIEYCAGWRDFANMGVSVVCTYDIHSHLTRTFLEEDFGDLKLYLGDQPTAGFNTRRFDLPLLEHHGISVDPDRHLDALERIWITLGLDPDRFDWRTHGGWSLDAIMTATFGLAKSGHGAMAPVWWQEGRRGRVIDYCCRDVWLEGKLIAHILAGKPVHKSTDDSGLKVSLSA